MKKPTKKVIIFLNALAAVIIVGVLVMILVPKGKPGPTVTPGTSVSPSASPSSSPSPSADEGTVEQKAVPEGTQYTVTVPDGVAYSVTINADAVKGSGKASDMRFVSAADSNDFVNITFEKGTKAVDLAPKIMDRYIKYNEFEQSGQNYIPGTEIAGETVAAGDGKSTLTAWLVDTDGGVLAVVVRNDVSDTESQTACLYDILKSLKIAE